MTRSLPLSRRTWLLSSALAVSVAAQAWADDARWPEEREAGVFRCHADFALGSHASLITELATLERDLIAQLDIAPPREEVHLFLFNRKSTYQAYLHQYFPKVPARRALFIKGRGPGMVFVYRSGELAVDVRHESTHALLHTSVSGIPLWLDEGLAEYYEVAAEERVTENPYVKDVRWNARLGYVPDLATLERLGDVTDMEHDHYRDAWAWTHFLLHHSGETVAVLREYLRALASDGDAGRLSEHLRRRIGDPDAAFLAHFRRWPVAD